MTFKNIKVVAQENLKKFNIENVVLISDNHERGYKKLGPYDIIISIDTSIIVKQELLEQIAEGGKLMFCEKLTFGMKESKLNVFYKQNNKYIKENLFDLNIPSQNNSDTINNQFDFN